MYFIVVSLAASWLVLFGFLLASWGSPMPPQPQPTRQACAQELVQPPPADTKVLTHPPAEMTPVKIKIGNSQPEIPAAEEDDLERKIRGFIENRMVNILVRMNVAACGGCTADDKRVIYQLKLMRALYDDDEKLIQLYSEKLKPYLKRKNEP